MMLAEPLDKLAVGVNVAVLISPVPLIALKVPPVTKRSPADPFQVKLVTGSSENVNVMVAVSPTLSVDTLEVMVTLGATVSIAMEGDEPADPVLPAASE